MFKKYFKIVFWIIFIIVAVWIGKPIFNSIYYPMTDGFKPVVSMEMFFPGNKPTEIANAEKYGYIYNDEIWSGTINVSGDIFVAKNATLTIKPGTTVLIAANSDKNNLIFLPFMLKKGIYIGEKFRDEYVHRGEPYEDEANHISIWVDGTLEAVGTPENKIIIKSDSHTPGRYDWTRLHIEHGTISYAKISDYRGMDLRSGTQITNSELHNGGGCLLCLRGSKDILIENNWLHDSNHEVMDIWNSSPTIVNNKIGPSPRAKNPGGYDAGWGGVIVGSGFPIIKGNTFEGFDDAVSFFNQASYDALAQGVLKNNTFRNNTEDVVLNLNPN